MDGHYLGGPNDAEVDALLSQTSDESILKLKVNSHKTNAAYGFEYPTFTDGWFAEDREGGKGGLDSQLASRLSSLKLPITKKRGKPAMVGAGGFNPERVGRNGRNSAALAKRGFGPESFGKKSGGDLDVVDEGEQNSDGSETDAGVKPKGRSKNGGEEEEWRGRAGAAPRRGEEGSGRRKKRHEQGRETPRALSHKTELLSCRSSEDLAASTATAGVVVEDDDPDNIDAVLQERFRALKAPPRPPSPAPPPPVHPARNVGLDNLMQFAKQRVPRTDYEVYGSSSSAPSSPSANLLGRSKSRSSPSPRIMTNSVSSSCHCSTPSPLKLLKSVSSKGLPSKQAQQRASGALPPRSPATRSGTVPGSVPPKDAGKEPKIGGSGNSKPRGKKSEGLLKETGTKEQGREEKKGGGTEQEIVEKREEKREKKKTTKKSSGSNDENKQPSTAKDMRRLLSSVADRVGLERSRVSSADEDDFLGQESHAWSVQAGEQELARASKEEKKLNREAERVVEWAKDVARLEIDDSDLDSDDADLGWEEADQMSGNSSSSDTSSKLKNAAQKKAPKKKKWVVF